MIFYGSFLGGFFSLKFSLFLDIRCFHFLSSLKDQTVPLYTKTTRYANGPKPQRNLVDLAEVRSWGRWLRLWSRLSASLDFCEEWDWVDEIAVRVDV